jgi:predicted helicase
LSIEAVEEMLIQHLLTRRIFRTIFHSESFLQKNAVARELEGVVTHLVQGYGTVEEFLKPLDRFYKALEMAAESTDDYAQKQTFLNTVYEKFFQGFAVKVADTHGIVYTPQPIVDFMVQSVQGALEADFGKSLTDEGVHVLDPFVGTGNFILRVMREIHEKNPAALRHKYLHELHCNEVMLLPYYIACLNIEHLYMELTGDYEPFPGICLVDSFELVEELQLGMFTNENSMRVQEQKDAPIFVVIGNPPYNAGQVNENDNNKNRKYPGIDQRVAETYAKDSKASNKNALSDPYVKAFRMASDRIIKNGEGLVCMVTNNGYLDGIAFDGFRARVQGEFDRIWLYDLRGNARSSGEQRRKEKGNVFNDTIRVGVAISMMERQASENAERHAGIKLTRLGDYLESGEKLHAVRESKSFQELQAISLDGPPEQGWLGREMADDWETLIPLGSKEAKAGDGDAVMYSYGRGLATSRDAWAYNHSRLSLESNMRRHIEEYNTWVAMYSLKVPKPPIDDFVKHEDEKLSWSRDLKLDLKRERLAKYSEDKVRRSIYRPYTLEWAFVDRIMNEEVYNNLSYFPNSDTKNLVIGVPGAGGRLPFWTIVSDRILNMTTTSLDATQCFPLYVYDEDGTNQRDNITDWCLQLFREHYSDTAITKLDIFHYVYGILHDPAYREKYAANLRRELPRIPFADDFRRVADIGKQLMELHVHYEDQPEFALKEVWKLPKGYLSEYGGEVTKVDQVPLRERYHVVKMKRNKMDPSELIVNDFLTLKGIPVEVDDYKLGNRSALDWIVDQYQIKTDKRSSITNDPNRDDDPTYIVRLLKKVVSVSLSTNELLRNLSD